MAFTNKNLFLRNRTQADAARYFKQRTVFGTSNALSHGFFRAGQTELFGRCNGKLQDLLVEDFGGFGANSMSIYT